MELGIGISQNIGPIRRGTAEQILHFRIRDTFWRAERKAADRPHDLLELAG